MQKPRILEKVVTSVRVVRTRWVVDSVPPPPVVETTAEELPGRPGLSKARPAAQVVQLRKVAG